MANPMYGQNKADTEVAVQSAPDVYVKTYTPTAAMGSDSGKVVQLAAEPNIGSWQGDVRNPRVPDSSAPML